MDFSEKLQQLRKEKGLTQEELAQHLFVSRTAISKWESGRGYPSIDSLKTISAYFSVTVDELLTGREALSIAAEEQKQSKQRTRDLVFGLLDISVAMFLFLPFLGEKTNAGVLAVSLLSLDAAASYVKISFISVVVALILFGITTLALQNYKGKYWTRYKYGISLILNITAILLFTVSPQPNCAVFCFATLVSKAVFLWKKQ